MATYRCPKHDFVFETEQDHSRPGAREVGPDNTQSGKLKHPQFKGGLSGHKECPLCKKAAKDKDPDLLPAEASSPAATDADSDKTPAGAGAGKK